MRCVKSNWLFPGCKILLEPAILFLALAGGPISSQANAQTSDPIIRINSEMHSAPIREIAVSEDCSVLATGSHDKTVRVWGWEKETPPTGKMLKLIRILRPPIGLDNYGKVNALAITRNGRKLAVGARFGSIEKGEWWVHVLDVSTGNIIQTVGPSPKRILSLAFSWDQAYLAAALRDGGGLIVWETKNWQRVAADSEYGKDKATNGVAFDRSGNVYTVSYDGFIRRYSPQFNLQSKEYVVNGKKPFSIAIHPSGDRIAVGYSDSVSVDVFAAKPLKHLFSTEKGEVDNYSLFHVGWSADGQRLYAGGDYEKDRRNPIRVWDKEGRGSGDTLAGPSGSIAGFAACDEDIVFGAMDTPTLGVLDKKGQRKAWVEASYPDMRDKLGNSLMISADARRVRFGLGRGEEEPVLFDVDAAPQKRLVEQLDSAPDLAAADTKSLKVEHWRYSPSQRRPSLDGKFLEFLPNERSQALAIDDSSERFVLGTEWRLRAYTAKGQLKWTKPLPTASWGVNIARSSPIVVAAILDGTICWYRLEDGEKLLTLFVAAKDSSDQRRWVAWTPQGYFDASPGGEDLFGWHVNRGLTKTADFFPASRFRDDYYRPDIVKLILTTLDEEVAIKQANQAAGRSRAADILEQQPPVVKILSPKDGGAFNKEDVTIEYELSSPSGLGVRGLRVMLDGIPLELPKDKGFEPVKFGINDRPNRRSLPLRLPKRDVTISLIAETEQNESEEDTVALRWSGATHEDTKAGNGVLHALLIGISKHKEKKWTLNFAAKDAKEVGERLIEQKERQNRLYKDVKVWDPLLLDEHAIEDSIRKALGLIRKRMARDGTDTLVVFFSGHGVTLDDQSTWLIDYDTESDLIDGTAMSKKVLIDALARIPGKVFLFIDACKSAAFDGTDMVNSILAKKVAILPYFSSLAEEKSFEWSKIKSGFFSSALLEALDGAGDSNGDRYIDSKELSDWLIERIESLSEGSQYPYHLPSPKRRPIRVFATQ